MDSNTSSRFSYNIDNSRFDCHVCPFLKKFGACESLVKKVADSNDFTIVRSPSEILIEAKGFNDDPVRIPKCPFVRNQLTNETGVDHSLLSDISNAARMGVVDNSDGVSVSVFNEIQAPSSAEDFFDRESSYLDLFPDEGFDEDFSVYTMVNEESNFPDVDTSECWFQTESSVGQVLSDTVSTIGQAAMMGAAFGLLPDTGAENRDVNGDRVDQDIATNTAITAQESTVEQELPFQEVPSGGGAAATSESKGDLERVSERWIKIKTVQWDGGDAIYKIIDAATPIYYPNDILNKTTAFSSFIRFFAYTKCNVRIKVIVNSLKFCTGAIAVCYAVHDGYNSRTFSYANMTYTNIRAVPHTIVNIQNATEGTFTIGYNNKTMMFDRENTEGRGRIVVIPWSKYQTVLGVSASTPVSIYAKIENLEVFGMTNEKTPFSLDYYLNARSAFEKEILRIENTGADVSSMYELLDSITAKLRTEADYQKVNISSYWVNTVNKERDDPTIDLSFASQVIEPGSDTLSQKPLSFEELLKIPTPYSTVQWSVSQTVGTALTTSEICPRLIDHSVYGSVSATSDWQAYSYIKLNETILSHISKFGHYWRGNLKFTFEFFNAALHKGRVKIGYAYGTRDLGDFDSTANYVTHDLGVQDKTELVVPYVSWRDWMQVPSLTTMFSSQHSKTKKYLPVTLKGSSLGTISIVVLNQLIGNNTMPTSIEIKMSISCDDFELVWPRFDSQHMDGSLCSPEATAWQGARVGLALNSSKPRDYYPQIAPVKYGDVPSLGITMETESLVGSFATQPLETSEQPTLPVADSYVSSYISNHVTIKDLMTRPSLAMHGSFVLCPASTGFTTTSRFAVYEAIKNNASTGVGTFKKAGVIVHELDENDFCQLGAYNIDDSYFERSEVSWPWTEKVKPTEQQLEICRLGSYWQGKCRAIVNVSVCRSLTYVKVDTTPTPKAIHYEVGPALADGTLFISYADNIVGSLKDIAPNGAYMMNLAQQRQAAFDIPFYQIEQVKRLDESDIKLRLYYSGAVCLLNVSVYYQFYDFNLYYPTLMPLRYYFAGGGNNSVKNKSEYVYCFAPHDYTLRDRYVDVPQPKGEDLSEKVSDITAFVGTIKIESSGGRRRRDLSDDGAGPSNPEGGYEEDLTEDGDVESNPGPNYKYSPNFPINAKHMLHRYVTTGIEPDFNELDNIYHPVIEHVNCGGDAMGEFCKIRFIVSGKAYLVEVAGKYSRQVLKIAKKKLVTFWLTHVRNNHPEIFEEVADVPVAVLGDFVEEDFQVEGLLDNIIASPAWLCKKITGTLKSIAKMLSLLSRADEILYQSQMKFWRVVTIIFTQIIHVINSPTLITAAASAVTVVLELADYLTDSIKANFEKAMENFFLKCCKLLGLFTEADVNDAEADAQDLEDDITIFESIAAGLSGLLLKTLGVVSTCVGFEFIRSTGMMAAATKNILQLLQMLWKTIEGTINYWVYGLTIEERISEYYAQNQIEIKLWCLEVADIQDSFRKEVLYRDFALCTRVKKAYKKGREIYDHLLTSHKFTGYFGSLRDTWVTISKWNEHVKISEGADKGRPEPVVVYIYGESGSGKSTMANFYGKQFSKYLGDVDGRYWSKPCKTKHYDGYAQQPVVIMDDFGSEREDEDYSDFLQLVSTTPYIPPLACADAKGMPFVSPLIIATSNSEPNYRPITLHHPEALIRRYKFKIRIVPKPEYVNDGKLDMGAATADGSARDMSCVCIRIVNIVGDDLVDGPLVTVPEFRKMVQREIVLRAKIFARGQETNDNEDSFAADMEAEGLWNVVCTVANAAKKLVWDPYPDCNSNVETELMGHNILNLLTIPQNPFIHDDGCRNCCHTTRPTTAPNGDVYDGISCNKFCRNCLMRIFHYWDPTITPETMHRDFAHLLTLSYHEQSCAIARKLYDCPDTNALYWNHKLFERNQEYYFSVLYDGYYDEGHDHFECRALIGKQFYWLTVQTAINSLNYLWHVKYDGRLGKFTMAWACPEVRFVTKFVKTVLIVQATVYTVKTLLAWLFPDIDEDAESYTSGEPAGKKPVKAKTQDHKVYKVENSEARIDYVKRNQYPISLLDDNGNYSTGMATFLDHNTVMTCNHLFLDRSMRTMRVHTTNPDGIPLHHDIPLVGLDMTVPGKDGVLFDLRIIRLREPFKYTRSIMNHFATNEEIMSIHRDQAILSTKSRSDPRTMLVVPRVSTRNVPAQSDYGSYQSLNSISYSCNNRGKGDSGALLFSNSAGSAGKIVGMHFCGSGLLGTAFPLSKDFITGIVSTLAPSAIPYVEPDPLLDGEPIVEGMPFLNDFTCQVGSVETEVHIARFTKIRRSPYHGKICDVKKFPAAMQVNDRRVGDEFKRDPIFNSIKKHAVNISAPRVDDLDKVVDHMKSLIYSMAEGDKDVLTEHQAVNGLGPGESMARVDMRTGAGYPFCQSGTKRDWLPLKEDGTDDHYIREDLLKRLHERIEMAKQRRRISGSYYRTALKDELRSWKKIFENGARTIEGCPLDFLLAFRQYFGSFLNWITLNYGGILGSCVGCDPNVDWTYFYDLLLQKGPNVFGIDFVNWDGSQSAAMIHAAWEIIEGYYLRILDNQISDNPDKEEELRASYEDAKNVRLTLMNEIAVTISIIGGKLVVMVNGLPSGHPCTAILNCILHKMLCLLAWLAAHRKAGVDTVLSEYEEHVANLFYGDDGLLSVSDEKLPIFNRFSIVNMAAELGMSSSMPDKSPIETPTDTIETVEFLKRKFAVHPLNANIILAPIDKKTIGGLLNWLRQSAKLDDNISDALRYAYHHGPEYYGKLRAKIAGLHHSTGLHLPSWKEQYERHLHSLGMLSKSWRNNPLIPPLVICVSRLQTKNGCTMKEWHKNGATTDNTYTCVCGKKVFGLIDRKCLCCHGFVCPEEYFFPEPSC